jgi:hypothetical protein
MWRDKVKVWLAIVWQDARRTRSWVASAQRNGTAFPSSLFIKIVRLFFASIAERLVKSALRDAASELGLTLSDIELTALANVAVALA